MFYKRTLPIGFSSRSGGLIVTRRTGKTFLIERMPRRWYRFNPYDDDWAVRVESPIITETITL
jgi:hypothetical protein